MPLTEMEFNLLRAFCRHTDQTLSRHRPLDPARPQPLGTVRGLGYRFTPAQAEA